MNSSIYESATSAELLPEARHETELHESTRDLFNRYSVCQASSGEQTEADLGHRVADQGIVSTAEHEHCWWRCKSRKSAWKDKNCRVGRWLALRHGRQP